MAGLANFSSACARLVVSAHVQKDCRDVRQMAVAAFPVRLTARCRYRIEQTVSFLRCFGDFVEELFATLSVGISVVDISNQQPSPPLDVIGHRAVKTPNKPRFSSLHIGIADLIALPVGKLGSLRIGCSACQLVGFTVGLAASGCHGNLQ